MVPAPSKGRDRDRRLAVAVFAATWHVLGAIWGAGTSGEPATEVANMREASTIDDKSPTWSPYKPNIVHRAREDGYVVAYARGPTSNAGLIHEGGSPNSLEVKTRFARWGGATMPVRKGRYWMVEQVGRRNYGIVVQWVPPL